MADWNFPPDTDVDPDAPVTSELMYALRDNPVAIAEGAVGAPRVTLSSMIQPTAGTDFHMFTVNKSTNPLLSIPFSFITGGVFTVEVVNTGSSALDFIVDGSVVLSTPGSQTRTANVSFGGNPILTLGHNASTSRGSCTVTSGSDSIVYRRL